ncbi:MAG: hypothetical protein FWG56_09945 [Desulfovibrionaceae bacterium]|jgi:hypothetical protein|nr:hypothetical protein [Desulfovibrionaceae bacterium]
MMITENFLLSALGIVVSLLIVWFYLSGLAWLKHGISTAQFGHVVKRVIVLLLATTAGTWALLGLATR